MCYFWALLSSEWEEEESEALLELLVEHYITVHGYSYASGWAENTSKHTRSRHKSLKDSGNSYFHRHSTTSSFNNFVSTFCVIANQNNTINNIWGIVYFKCALLCLLCRGAESNSVKVFFPRRSRQLPLRFSLVKIS